VSPCLSAELVIIQYNKRNQIQNNMMCLHLKTALENSTDP